MSAPSVLLPFSAHCERHRRGKKPATPAQQRRGRKRCDGPSQPRAGPRLRRPCAGDGDDLAGSDRLQLCLPGFCLGLGAGRDRALLGLSGVVHVRAGDPGRLLAPAGAAQLRARGDPRQVRAQPALEQRDRQVSVRRSGRISLLGLAPPASHPPPAARHPRGSRPRPPLRRGQGDPQRAGQALPRWPGRRLRGDDPDGPARAALVGGRHLRCARPDLAGRRAGDPVRELSLCSPPGGSIR